MRPAQHLPAAAAAAHGPRRRATAPRRLALPRRARAPAARTTRAPGRAAAGAEARLARERLGERRARGQELVPQRRPPTASRDGARARAARARCASRRGARPRARRRAAAACPPATARAHRDPDVRRRLLLTRVAAQAPRRGRPPATWPSPSDALVDLARDPRREPVDRRGASPRAPSLATRPAASPRSIRVGSLGKHLAHQARREAPRTSSPARPRRPARGAPARRSG